MNVLERHRGALAVTGVAVFLVFAGRFAYTGFHVGGFEFGWVTVLRLALAAVGALIVLSVAGVFIGAVNGVVGNGKASMGQGLMFSSLVWIASDRAELDWRALRNVALVILGLVVAAVAPAWVWVNAPIVGGFMLAGQVVGVFWSELFGDDPRWGRWLRRPRVVEESGWGRDAKRIRREWPKHVQDLMSKGEGPVKSKVKAPKLVDVNVAERWIRLDVEPPAMWSDDGLNQLATGLMHSWSGKQHRVTPLESDRMSSRLMRIEVAMKPLPEDLPYPVGDSGFGAPIGEDLMGNVLRIEIGSKGVPHVLVAGQSGSGKSNGMRVIGHGMVNQGADVCMIDPKGEGDLDGISKRPTLYLIAEWVDWLDWLWDEQQRRAQIKRDGGDPGRPIVTMIDELTQITKQQGGRTDHEKQLLKAAAQSYARMINIGRGTGIHIVSGIQMPSAENMGGGTDVRAQHLGRIIFGRDSTLENRKMVLGDRNVSDADIAAMQYAPPGRAWVSGMTPRETGRVHCVQFFNYPEATAQSRPQLSLEDEFWGVERAASQHHPVAEPPTPEPASSEPVAASLRDLVVGYVHEHGPTERPVLQGLTDPPAKLTTLRRVLRRAREDGLVAFDDGPARGNQVVVVHPAGVWPPTG